MEKIVSQRKINEAIKNAQVEKLDLKEPSVEIKYESKTHSLPRFIRVTQEIEETQVYKPVIDEEIDYSPREEERKNRILNILLVGCIVFLTILVVMMCILFLQLLGVM